MMQFDKWEFVALVIAWGVISLVLARRAGVAAKTDWCNTLTGSDHYYRGFHHAGVDYVVVPQRKWSEMRDAIAGVNDEIDREKERRDDDIANLRTQHEEAVRVLRGQHAADFAAQRKVYDEDTHDLRVAKDAIERACAAAGNELGTVRAERDKLKVEYDRLGSQLSLATSGLQALQKNHDHGIVAAHQAAEEKWEARVKELEAACDHARGEEGRMAEAYNGAMNDLVEMEKKKGDAEFEVKKLQGEMANFVIRHNELAAAHRARLQKVHDLADVLHVWMVHGAGKPCPLELVADKPTAICGADGTVHLVPEGELG